MGLLGRTAPFVTNASGGGHVAILANESQSLFSFPSKLPLLLAALEVRVTA